MKHLKSFENNMLDNILDKITKSGIDSLSSNEKEYLDKFSKDKPTKEIEKEINAKTYSDSIGPYDAVIKLTDIEQYDEDKQWFGVLSVLTKNGNLNYDGYITIKDGEYVNGFFKNSESDIYTDLEGLEYEVDSFLQNAFYELWTE